MYTTFKHTHAHTHTLADTKHKHSTSIYFTLNTHTYAHKRSHQQRLRSHKPSATRDAGHKEIREARTSSACVSAVSRVRACLCIAHSTGIYVHVCVGMNGAKACVRVSVCVYAWCAHIKERSQSMCAMIAQSIFKVEEI